MQRCQHILVNLDRDAPLQGIRSCFEMKVLSGLSYLICQGKKKKKKPSIPFPISSHILLLSYSLSLSHSLPPAFPLSFSLCPNPSCNFPSNNERHDLISNQPLQFGGEYSISSRPGIPDQYCLLKAKQCYKPSY